jgi:uridine monophosphate synthetase
MQLSFADKLKRAMARNDSLLCVGLDPDPARPSGPSGEEELVRWGQGIIEQTADVVCCYKPNFAFYEQYGPQGLRALRRTIAAVPDDVPVLLDAKRGDIGNTAAAYARAAFEVWGADGITISPYLGRDSVDPFLAYPGKAVFILCYTSNPSAAAIQDAGTPPLYRHVARLAQAWGDEERVGFVVGATRPEKLAEVRGLAPERWILAPGVGAQGGDLGAALRAGLTAGGGGLIVPVSRAVLYADDPRAAARDLRDRICRERDRFPAAGEQPSSSPRTRLALGLHDAQCIRFGTFTLASGRQSPIYVDLRRAVSYPVLLKEIAAAYAALAQPLSFDRLAAVPYAALPLGAAVALHTDRPLIYPRKEVKAHGTGRAVEGDFEAGQTALVVEDVVTSGDSILQAIESLESAGLSVEDVVVLVDREQGGRESLAERGCRLHAVLTLGEILDVLLEEGRILRETYRDVQRALSS